MLKINMIAVIGSSKPFPWEVFFYKAFLTRHQWNKLETKTDEKIERIFVESIPYADVVPNLRWLIPLALNKDDYEPIGVHERDAA